MEITWPTTGEKQVFKDLAMNQHIKVTEGNNQFETLTLNVFEFQSTPEKSFTHKMMMTMDMGDDRYMDMQHGH